LTPLQIVLYINNIWMNIDQCIRLFDDCCIIYRNITNKKDIAKLHKYVNALEEWTVESGIEINRVKNHTGYSFCNYKIPEADSCK
jgi:hypothetical protein